MVKMKQCFAVLLALCMALSACGTSEPSGKGGQNSEASGQEGTKSEDNAMGESAGQGISKDSEILEKLDGGADAIDWDDDPAEVNWLLWNVGGTFTQEGLQAVEDAVNAITLEKINVHVNMEMLEMGAYLSQMPMQVGAGDKIDLITTFPAGSGAFNTMATVGQLIPLDSLLEEYASETLALFSDEALAATTVDGTLYAVPVYTDYTNDLYWVCRKSYLEEAGFAAEDIHSIEDITKVFEAVHKLHPDMKMVSSGSKSLLGQPFATGTDFDTLGTKLLAVMIDKDKTKVVSLYESDEYKEIYAILRDWYEKGYIDKDIMIREDDPTGDNTVFSGFLGGNRARTTGSEAMAGEPMVSVKISEGCISTSSMAIMTMGIPVSATEPEAAARLLNLCYTDKELKMLVSYGIEGTNYSYDAQGGVVADTSSNYAPNTLGIFGNAMLCDPSSAEVAIGYSMNDVDQSKLKYSPLLGFFFNSDPVSNEAAALSNVFTEYQGQIDCGLADEATLQEFIEKLYANGFQKYMDEAQKQLDEWLANQE